MNSFHKFNKFNYFARNMLIFALYAFGEGEIENILYELCF